MEDARKAECVGFQVRQNTYPEGTIRSHCEKAGEPYEEIKNNADDPRANRITSYLNLIDRLVQQQVKDLPDEQLKVMVLQAIAHHAHG